MSYYANTLFPTVTAVFEDSRELPTTPKAAADKIRAAGYPREAAVIEGLSFKDLVNVYEWSGLVSKDSKDDAWEMAESEWSGR